MKSFLIQPREETSRAGGGASVVSAPKKLLLGEGCIFSSPTPKQVPRVPFGKVVTKLGVDLQKGLGFQYKMPSQLFVMGQKGIVSRQKSAPSENLSLIPSTHGLLLLQCPFVVSQTPGTHLVHRHTCRQNAHSHKVKL